MKAVEFSVPGKTFLAGEYLALTGGPALVLLTEPRFQMKVRPELESKNPFHPESPAGKFWQQHQDFFSQYKIEFMDPFKVGGFGASSAQFAMLHAFWQSQEASFEESERFFDWHQMLLDYRSLPVEGLPPSGADVIGAVSGGLTWFDRSNGKLQTFAWPFQEMELFVAHTGQKLATHEHLKEITEIETEEFSRAMPLVLQGLSQVNFEIFLQGLQKYKAELFRQNRVAPTTVSSLAELEKSPEILFSKGCGAMGSDVILAICHKENSEKVHSLLQKQNLKVIADSSKISQGLQVRHLSSNPKELSL